MTIYLSTNADGMNTEGIGAMVQSQLFTKALSDFFKCGYIFRGFKNFTHFQYFDITQEKFMKDINEFFNLYENQDLKIKKINISSYDDLLSILNTNADDVEIELEPGLVTHLGQYYLSEFEKSGSIRAIKNKFKFKLEKPKEFGVALHIRKFTKTDCDTSEVRDYFTKEKEEYYLNLIDSLRETYQNKNPKFQIYSQGSEEEFNFLRSSDVSFFIEEYPLDSIEKMLKADVFVMANSSMSYIAHLLRDHITYCKLGFYHKTYDSLKLFIGYDGIV